MTVFSPRALCMALGLAAGVAPSLHAQSAQSTLRSPVPATAATDAPAPGDASASRLTWTLGVRLKMPDLADTGRHQLRPVVGLRYGRFRLGIGDGEEWLQFNGFRKEPTFSVGLFDSQRISTAFSLRIHNLSSGESFDPFESGRHTVRARGLITYRITDRWSLGGEVTHDVLNRGDGQTLSVGLGHRIPLGPRDVLFANAGVTFGTAEHWRTSVATTPGAAAVAAPGAGLGTVGVGAGYRHALSRNWAWYGSLGASHPLGDVANAVGHRWGYSAQLGLLYFSR